MQGDPGFVGVSVWYHGVAKMMTSNSLALLLAACVSVSGGGMISYLSESCFPSVQSQKHLFFLVFLEDICSFQSENVFFLFEFHP